MRTNDEELLVKVEDISLVTLSSEKSLILQSYQEKYLLTAFVYFTGGPYKAYDPAREEMIQGEKPLGMDIFVQFT